MEGKVKWFNDRLGYGFIETEGIEKDIYIHYSDIKRDGYKTLKPEQNVIFDYVEENNKAVNLKIVPKKYKFLK